MHLATTSDDNIDCLMYIIETYPDLIHTTDNEGHTPLHDAAKHGSIRCLTALLEAGADFIKVDCNYNTQTHRLLVVVSIEIAIMSQDFYRQKVERRAEFPNFLLRPSSNRP